MSKKKKKRRVVIHKNQGMDFDKESFLSELDLQVRKIFQGMILPVEQRMDSIYDDLQTVKSNVVVANSLLEKKGVLTREEFFKEFEEFERTEVAKVDGSGQMKGSSVYSIYN